MNERPFEKKQKPKLRWWWFLFIPVFLIGMIVIQAIGPNPPIKLGPDTTVISEPVRENGMPNYTEYLVRKSANGVTPDNNAAVLYWRAMWPGELDAKHEQAIVDALEMDWPDANESLETPYDKAVLLEIHNWIVDTVPNADVELLEEAEPDIIGRALTHRWQPGELPFVDAWAARNEQALDWIVEGSMRPKYFSPPPNYASGGDAMLFAWLLPDIQMMRGASRALLLRAMWHVSHDRYSEAWDNIFASYRMSRHSGASGTFLIHLLVGIAVEAMTNETFLTLLDQEGLSGELLERIQRDFDSLRPMTPIHEVFAEGERFGSLDIATRISSGEPSDDSMDYFFDTSGPAIATMAGRVRVDWNVVLRAANAWFDRFEEVAKLPYQERKEKLEQIDIDLQGLNPTRSSGRLAYSLVSVGARSEVVADTLLMLLLPATQAAVKAQDRGDTNRSLIRLSIALARYRKAQGEFPVALDALETEFIDAVPNDLYSDDKLIYQRRQNGYLLYSIFENEIDDGGTGIAGDIVRGEYVKEARSVDLAACDLVVRMPRPAFELPEIPLAPADDELEPENDEREDQDLQGEEVADEVADEEAPAEGD